MQFFQPYSKVGFSLTLIGSVLIAANASAQQPGDPPPGAEFYNETQLSLAAAVFGLVDEYNRSGAATAAMGLEREMYDICSRYNNNVWTPISNAEEAAAVLEQADFIAHEEVGASGSSLSDTSQNQTNAVLGRMQQLRGVSPSIASYSGMTFTGGAAGDDFSKLSFFSNINYGDGSKDRTSREQGFDFDSAGLTAGIDYRFTDEIIAGAALGFSQSDADINNNLGKSESDTVSLTLYSTYYFKQWHMDAVLGYSQQDYDNQRSLLISQLMAGFSDQFISSSTEGDSLHFSLGGGFSQQLSSWTASYSARLDYTDSTIDGYTENTSQSLALVIDDQDVESLQLVAAAQFSRSYSRSWGVINPYVGVEVHQEFEDETRVVSARYFYDQFNNTFSFTSDDSDSNYVLLSLGSSFVLGQGKQVFVNYDRVELLDDVDSHSLTAGIRFEL